MWFEWDAKKAEKNLKKHGVSFDLAVTVFNDRLHLSIPDRASTQEERWITVGMAADQKTLVVVHTYKEYSSGDEMVRIISARTATKKEKEDYEEGI